MSEGSVSPAQVAEKKQQRIEAKQKLLVELSRVDSHLKDEGGKLQRKKESKGFADVPDHLKVD